MKILLICNPHQTLFFDEIEFMRLGGGGHVVPMKRRNMHIRLW